MKENEGLKQRLVGLLVLVSIGFILVTSFLEDSPPPEVDITTTTVPAPPFNESPEVPNFQDEPVLPPMPGSQVVEESDVEITQIPEHAVVVDDTTTELVEDPEPVAETNPEAPIESESASSHPFVSWVVQVGAFGNAQNAFKLRDRLKAAQFSAYVEEYTAAGKKMYRVRVGKEVKKERAEKFLKAIQEQFEPKAVLLKLEE